MYELRVLTGLHRGAALPLVGGEQWSIGAAETADLVLFDPGIQLSHCQILQTENGWSIEGDQGQVIDSEGHRLDLLENLAPNIPFALHGVWFAICDASVPWPEEDTDEQAEIEAAKPKKKPVLPFVFGFLSAITIVASTTWAALSPQSPEGDGKVGVEQGISAKPVLGDANEVASQLRKMLSERELGSLVTVKVHQGELALTGGLNESDRELVSRMLARFQLRFSTPVNIKNETGSLKAQLPFTITQIVAGNMAHVVTSDNRRIFIGDQIDGLRLVSVNENKVVFKGNQDIEVTW
ncbi:FHA domain-containing protein [Pokkaliibacter sp. CJK22405]|uniref:FHA domain-containing protein n=1 Tax=Pokkaliibacter sp. CJK22405 TaxID=3384615 RepID=UPI0039849ADC